MTIILKSKSYRLVESKNWERKKEEKKKKNGLPLVERKNWKSNI